MPGPDPIRVNYIREFIKLSLWYVHWRVREGLDTFADAVNLRVNIYRNTSLYDGVHHPSNEDVGPEWTELVERLKAIYDRHRSNPSTEQLETEGLDLLWPYLEPRLPRSGGRRRSREDRPYECWGFDVMEDRVHLHVGNFYRPRSPLSDMRIPFAASLIRLLRDIRGQHPGVGLVCCGSWLNSAPRFHALFPESWLRDAIQSREVGYGMGHRGQFYDRRGDFHVRHGEKFRATGELPFPSLRCKSPIEKVLTHLKSGFPEAVEYNSVNSRKASS